MIHLKIAFIILLLMILFNDAMTTSTVPEAQISTVISIISEIESLLKFRGHILRGQAFEQNISQTLVFRLIPHQYGWQIWIGNKTKPLDDYVGVVTPPYYGMNARFIEGWHFRNSDNSGPNELGPKVVQAPQRERRFYFVLNEQDYKAAYEGLDTRDVTSKEERKKRWARREELNPQRGKLTITHLDLGNLVLDEKARIETMEFEVELSLPPDFE